MKEEKRVTAIILLAGNSTRFGKNRNKNLERIDNKPIFQYSLEKPQIEEIVTATKQTKPFIYVEGGSTRKESVYHALQHTTSEIVLIHDGARPMIKSCYIDQCLQAMQHYKGASMAVKSKDTIKVTNEKREVIQTTKRETTWLTQTPQCFSTKELLRAHEKYQQEEEITDDCMLLEKEKEQVVLIEGDYTNIKVTTYDDMKLAEEFLKLQKETN